MLILLNHEIFTDILQIFLIIYDKNYSGVISVKEEKLKRITKVNPSSEKAILKDNFLSISVAIFCEKKS